MSINRCFVLWVCLALLAGASAWAGEMLRWEELPALPDTPGLGGPLVGVHNDALIVAGGAYFPEPVWESEKLWRDEAWVLVASGAGGYEWLAGFKLDRPIAYAACVSTPYGVACLGGTDGQTVFDHCFLLRCDPLVRWVSQEPLPPLPEPCAYGAAARIGDVIYLAGGQRGSAFDTAEQLLAARSVAAGRSGRCSAGKPCLPGPDRVGPSSHGRSTTG